MNDTILAVGAGGKFAGLVVPVLAKWGAAVRAMIRTCRRSVFFLASPDADLVTGQTVIVDDGNDML